jgi:membrane fusion protein (multidrug efflux system)
LDLEDPDGRAWFVNERETDQDGDEEGGDARDEQHGRAEQGSDPERSDRQERGRRQSSDSDEGEDDNKNGGKNKKKSRLPIIILIVVAILAVVVGVIYWLSTRDEESTDDAYTEGNAVSIAPKVSGYIVERRVDDNTFVHAGDLMLRIDPRDYITARDQARANLDLARAQLRSAEIDLEISRVRYPSDKVQAQAQLDQARANEADAKREYLRQKTVDQRATTQTAVDQATTQFETASATVKQMEAQLQVSSLVPQNIASVSTTLQQRQAQVEQAQAQLDQAQLNLSYCDIVAPQDGKVTRRNVDVGTYAQAGQQAFYLVPPQTWVVANFKETQLARMRVGQHVDISVDAYPDMRLHGHVQSIQEGAGARFTAFPSENATGNFVKIVRRVPVKIVIDDGMDPQQGLPLGLSVEPTVALK